MRDYVPELLSLDAIVLQRKSFEEAMFSVSVTERISLARRKELKENVFSLLRHYYLYSLEAQEVLSSLEDESDEFFLALVLLQQLRHGKEESEVQESFRETVSRLRLSYQENVFALLSESAKKEFLFPEELKKNKVAYEAIRLNVPNFIYAKACDQFGHAKAFRVFTSLRKKPMRYLRLISGTPLQEMIPHAISEDLVIYEIPSRMDKTLLENSLYYALDYTDIKAVSEVEIPPVSPKALVLGCKDSSMALALADRCREYYDSKVNAVFTDAELYRQSIDYKAELKLRKYKPVLSELSLVKTYLPAEDYDIVIALGESSDIALSGKKPGITTYLKENDLYKNRKKQLDMLLESSIFVKKDGFFMLENHSLLEEETISVVKDFLSLRENFELVKSEYILPSEEETNGGYYAILRRIR